MGLVGLASARMLTFWPHDLWHNCPSSVDFNIFAIFWKDLRHHCHVDFQGLYSIYFGGMRQPRGSAAVGPVGFARDRILIFWPHDLWHHGYVGSRGHPFSDFAIVLRF